MYTVCVPFSLHSAMPSMRPGSLYACITCKEAALQWRADVALLDRWTHADERSYRGPYAGLPQTACEDLLRHDREQPAAYVLHTDAASTRTRCEWCLPQRSKRPSRLQLVGGSRECHQHPTSSPSPVVAKEPGFLVVQCSAYDAVSALCDYRLQIACHVECCSGRVHDQHGQCNPADRQSPRPAWRGGMPPSEPTHATWLVSISVHLLLRVLQRLLGRAASLL